MKIVVSIATREDFGPMRQQTAQRDRFQKRFRELLFAEPQLRGRVLDIGCGGAFPPPLIGIEKLSKRVDEQFVRRHPARRQALLEGCRLKRLDRFYVFREAIRQRIVSNDLLQFPVLQIRLARRHS